MNTIQRLEEEDHEFSRQFPDYDGWARLDGYCCARFARGGDCRHSVADWEFDLPDGVLLDAIDGRPLPPWWL